MNGFEKGVWILLSFYFRRGRKTICDIEMADIIWKAVIATPCASSTYVGSFTDSTKQFGLYDRRIYICIDPHSIPTRVEPIQPIVSYFPFLRTIKLSTISKNRNVYKD